MNDLEQWPKQNDAYLAAAVAWLRLRLTYLAESGEAPKPADSEPVGERSLFNFFHNRPAPAPEATAPESAVKTVTAEAVAAAAKQMDEAAASEPPPALFILSERFGLSWFEQEVLLLCAAMELDTRLPALCARAQDDPNRPYPTFALALALFDEPSWDALSPERPLRYWRLIDINQPPAQPLTGSPLRADMRIVNYLKGLDHLDDRLAPLLAPFEVAAIDLMELPASQQAMVNKIIRYLELMPANGQSPIIQLLGLDPFSKQLVAGHAAAKIGLQLYRLPAELLPIQADELENVARLWQREGLLLPQALYLDAHEVDDVPGSETQPTASMASPLRRFLARSQGIFFIGTRDVRPGLGPATISVEVDKPTPTEQQAAWAEMPNNPGSPSPALLTGQFNLNVAAIKRIARLATAEAVDTRPANGPLTHEQLWQACLVSTRPRLDLLAQRINAKATWDDIVLPEETLALLGQIADQVGQRSQVYDAGGWRAKMNRGLGISALFAGDSGTGKTMAAEVIANALRLNLYRIDLSAVVSKYIGETEKNLRRLFDAAEDGGAILFFDEADALFGKRSEVKDSHDRYANIEVNYLLQRMEAYGSLAILATNRKSALDDAFLRRLRFIVDFPFPNLKERQIIWEKVFPPQTKTEGVDYERLASLSLTGGSIHNIALNASFLAAHASQPVSMAHLLRAARTEFRKLERPVREADFYWEEKSVASYQPLSSQVELIPAAKS